MAFESRTPVNGSMLRNFVGKTVSILVKVESEGATQIRARTTDDQEIRVNLPEVITARTSDWIEIIGTPAGSDTIRAREVILFGGGEQELDVEGYNMMVQFWNHSKDIYKQG